MTRRVLIVGAGPTSLTAAVELARRGIVPAVIEKRPGPSQLSRAVGILPPTLDILRPSGVTDALLAEAVPFSGVTFHRGASRLASIDFAPLPNAPSPVLGLAQDRTEQHLAEGFARHGGEVRFDTELIGLEGDDAGVTVHLPTGTERYDLVIGADGVASAVRRALGVAYRGYEVPGHWSIADVDCTDWPDPTRFKAFLLPRGRVCIVAPLEATRFRVIASTDDALAALPVPINVTNLRRTSAFQISVRQVDSYRVGRVFLAGDAAHCHSPVGGRGMNLGIADAADLARRIAEGGLDGYHAARHPAGAETIRLTERGRRLVQARSALGRAPLYAMLKAIDLIPPLGRAAIRRIAQR